MKGFPLPDVDVRHFLIGDDTDTPILAYVKFLAFLFAAFSRTLKALKAFPKDHSLGIPERFRSFLAEGQSANSVGPNRKAFYAEIIAEAIQVGTVVGNILLFLLLTVLDQRLSIIFQNGLLGLVLRSKRLRSKCKMHYSAYCVTQPQISPINNC